MRYIEPKNGYIRIGHQVDNDTLTVILPEYEGFNAYVNIKRPGDDSVYVSTPTLTDNGWEWLITDTDVANAGRGVAQVEYTDGDGAVCMSIKYELIVETSIIPTGDVPTPLESWYQDMLDATDTAVRAKDDAEGHASAAAESARLAGLSESAAAASELNAQGYADRAEQAAADAGYMEFKIDANGHLIYSHTDSVDAIDFDLVNGHLILEVS